MPQIDQNGPDFAYNVSFKKPGSAWQHEVVKDAESYTISKAGVDQLWEFRVQSKNAEGDGPECSIEQARTARTGMETPDIVIQPRCQLNCSRSFVCDWVSKLTPWEAMKKQEDEAVLKILLLSFFSSTMATPNAKIQGDWCRLCDTRMDNS